jgi:hypothetical protein
MKYELRFEGETSIEVVDHFATPQAALEYVREHYSGHHRCPVLKDTESGQEWYADWGDSAWLALD